MDYNARYYSPYLNQFTQPDTIIPDPYNILDWNRYAYVRNNPINHNDPSGHCIDGVSTIACIVAIVAAVSVVADYAWTAWDSYQSSQVLIDPTSSPEDKIMAGMNIGLAAAFELFEPDDLLPVGLPIDDVARKGVMKGAREAFETGGKEALDKFIRSNLGDHADEFFKNLDNVLGFNDVTIPQPSQTGQSRHIFRPAHNWVDTPQNRSLIMDTITWDNYLGVNHAGNQIFANILDDGTEVWVQVRYNVVQNAGINLIPKLIK